MASLASAGSLGAPPFRKPGQVKPRRFVDLGARPFHGPVSVRVEELDGGTTASGVVVIAPDAKRADRAQPIDYGLGLRTVADGVAEMPDRVDCANRGEHRL